MRGLTNLLIRFLGIDPMATVKQVKEVIRYMKTKMVSMERPKPKKSDVVPGSPAQEYYEKYSYGTRIRLSSEEIEKLGIDVTELRAGQSVTIRGQCEICSVSTDDSMDENGKSKQDQRLEIQIQKLALASQDSFKGGFDDEDGE